MNRHSQTWRNKLLVYLEYWITRILPPLFGKIWEIWDCSYTGHKVIFHNTFKSEAKKKIEGDLNYEKLFLMLNAYVLYNIGKNIV